MTFGFAKVHWYFASASLAFGVQTTQMLMERPWKLTLTLFLNHGRPNSRRINIWSMLKNKMKISLQHISYFTGLQSDLSLLVIKCLWCLLGHILATVSKSTDNKWPYRQISASHKNFTIAVIEKLDSLTSRGCILGNMAVMNRMNVE